MKTENARQAYHEAIDRLEAHEGKIKAEVAAIKKAYPPGTPNRTKLMAAARSDSGLGDLVELRREIYDELEARRKAWLRSSMAAERAADPQQKLRRWVFRWLRKLGFSREHTSGESAYYCHATGLAVRVSQHEVPDNPERDWNAQNGGFSWAHTWRSLTLHPEGGWREAAEWLIQVRDYLHRQAELATE